MITTYMVNCPHPGCRWSGSLLPRDGLDAWIGLKPTRLIVVFQCPECGGEWRARIVGDDVVPLPVSETVSKPT